MNAEQLRAAAEPRCPGLGIATVYRAIETGLEEGWLQPVDLPGSDGRFVERVKPHHHHFVCRACGNVYDLDGCPGNFRALLPRGFRLERHDVTLYGTCRTCGEAA